MLVATTGFFGDVPKKTVSSRPKGITGGAESYSIPQMIEIACNRVVQEAT